MTPDQFKQILDAINRQVYESVKPAIDAAVNGKVNGLRQELQNYIQLDTEWKIHDKEWKDEAQPVLDMGHDIKAGNRILIWMGTIIGSVGAMYGAVRLAIYYWVKIKFRL